MVFLRDLQLNTGMVCAKYLLLIVSFMFAITAVLLVMVGSTIQAIFGDFRQFVDEYFLTPPTLIISIGFILLFVAFLGAYGAIKESVMLINMYGICLFAIFILEVSASIAAFIMQGQVSQMLERTLNDSLVEYDGSDYIQDAVDFMQGGLGCCGVNSAADWHNNYGPKSSINSLPKEMVAVPESCCKRFSEDTSCQEYYEMGCLPRLHFVISQSTMLIATGATTVSFVQLMGSICAFMLAKTLRRNKSLREARRWQLQQSLGILMMNNKAATIEKSSTIGYTELEKGEEPLCKKFAPPSTYEPIRDYTSNSPSVN